MVDEEAESLGLFAGVIRGGELGFSWPGTRLTIAVKIAEEGERSVTMEGR